MLITPVLRKGGKSQNARKIAELLPRHRVYVEPFCGGAAVFFAKKRSDVEVLNDLDPMIFNFFRFLRDDPASLFAEVERLGFGEDAYELACSVHLGSEAVSDLTSGALGLILSRTSYGGSGKNMKTGYTESKKDLIERILRRLADFSSRMRGVVLHNKDALSVMRQYDSPDTCLFVDPPYIGATFKYSHDVNHDELFEFCLKAESKILLAGYSYLEDFACEHGWAVHKFKFRDILTIQRDDYIIANFSHGTQLSLFDMEGNNGK